MKRKNVYATFIDKLTMQMHLYITKR